MSEPNRQYQFKCRRFLLSRFLEGALYKYLEWMYAIQDKNTGKEIVVSCSLLNWLIECLCPSLTNDRHCELLRKSFKNTFWSPILHPLSPAPEDNFPRPLPYATGKWTPNSYLKCQNFIPHEISLTAFRLGSLRVKSRWLGNRSPSPVTNVLVYYTIHVAPSTSVASKRLFNAAGQIIYLRSNFSWGKINVEKLLFLAYNIRLFGCSY